MDTGLPSVKECHDQWASLAAIGPRLGALPMLLTVLPRADVPKGARFRVNVVVGDNGVPHCVSSAHVSVPCPCSTPSFHSPSNLKLGDIRNTAEGDISFNILVAIGPRLGALPVPLAILILANKPERRTFVSVHSHAQTFLGSVREGGSSKGLWANL